MNLNSKILKFHLSPGYFWFRIFGRGLFIKDTRRYRLLFSERYGYRKTIRIKWLCIGTCGPEIKHLKGIEAFQESQPLTFFAFGHDSKGNALIVKIDAETGAEALDGARKQRPDCRFHHVNLK